MTRPANTHGIYVVPRILLEELDERWDCIDIVCTCGSTRGMQLETGVYCRRGGHRVSKTSETGAGGVNLYEELMRCADPNHRILLRRVVRQRSREDPRARRIAKWKENVRARHRDTTPMEACAECGKTTDLSRHHDWNSGRPHAPPKVSAVLCKFHQAIAEGTMHPVWCLCGSLLRSRGSFRRHRNKCRALRETIVEIRSW